MQGMMKKTPGPLAPPVIILPSLGTNTNIHLVSSAPEDDGPLVLLDHLDDPAKGEWQADQDKQEGEGSEEVAAESWLVIAHTCRGELGSEMELKLTV